MEDKPVPKEMERCKQVLKALLNKWPYSTTVPISENSYKLLNRALNINLEDDLIMEDKPVPKEMERCKQALKALLNKWPYSTTVPISEHYVQNQSRR